MKHGWLWALALLLAVAGEVLAKAEDGRFVWRATGAPPVIQGQTLRTWRHEDWVRSVAFSPDGRRVLTGSGDNTAVLRDAETGQTLHTWRHGHWVLSVAFSPDGRRVLTGSEDKTAVLHDVETGQTLHTWPHEGRVHSVAFSPDGRRVLTGSDDKTAVLRDAGTGETLRTWRHGSFVLSAAFSPDGRRVLTGSGDNTAVLRDAETGQTLHTWRHEDWVRSVAFSPDSRRVLTGSDDKTAVLRDAETGQTLHTWRHESWVYSVAFSPDSRRVLTGSDDKTAVLRDAETGQTLHTWRHGDWVRSVAFSPDGRRVLTGSSDKTAVLRDAGTDLPAALASRLAPAEQAHRSPPASLAARQAELERNRPAAKDEYESQAQYAARVAEWNAAVKQVNQAIATHYARLGPLPLAERAQAMQQAVGDTYGDPVLVDIRYDAETAKFFATLKPRFAPAIQRTLVIAVPNKDARTAKAALEKGDAVSVQMRVDAQNALFWEGATVTLDGKTQVAQFTDAAPAITTVANVSTPALAHFAPTPLTALATLPAPTAVPISDDPKLAKLQREVLEKERAQAQQAAREAEEKRLRERLAQLEASGAAVFDDDLAGLLNQQATAKPDPHLSVLVIGIEDYADVPDVPFADRSAQLFAQLAQKRLGVRPENLIRLTNAEASMGRLKGRIKTLLNRLGPKDRLLVYFAGHGVPAQDGKSAYLLAQDGGPGSYEEPDLQLDQLYAAIDKSRVGQASLFIDACFSGRSDKNSIVFEGVGGITLVPKHGLRPDSRISVITAGKNDQFSNQDKTHGHRLFGYHLMKALLEDGPNQTAEQLHAKLRDRVLSDSRRIGPEFEQEPELRGNGKVAVGR